jgi:hypothetical protein
MFMSREEIIEKTVTALKRMPESKGEEVADFAEFILKRSEEKDVQKGIEYLIENSDSFAFLNEEEEIYTLDDLKEKYK